MQTHSGILSSVESHFRISQEDEAVLGVTLGCSPWAKKHVLAIEARESPNFKQHGDVRFGLRRYRRGSPQVLQVYFAAVRDSHDVAAPGECSSAVKPKIEHRPIFLQAIPLVLLVSVCSPHSRRIQPSVLNERWACRETHPVGTPFRTSDHGGTTDYHASRNCGQACLDDDACISYDFPGRLLQILLWTTLPENRGCDLTFAWGEYSGFYTLTSRGNPSGTFFTNSSE